MHRLRGEVTAELANAQVRGVDFNGDVSLDMIMQAMLTTGFQATEVGRAIEVSVGVAAIHRFAAADASADSGTAATGDQPDAHVAPER